MAERSADAVVPLILELPVTVGSVVDIGCGTGSWAAAFNVRGIDVVGVDGDYVDRKSLRIRQDQFIAHDLNQPLDLGRRFDLAVSLEVGEHLDAGLAAGFVDSLIRHADVVLFSAAVPGQGGSHHVNERWPSYWVALFEQRGYRLFDVVRPAVWNLPDVAYWYSQNLLLFATGGPARNLQGLDLVVMGVLDVVHPSMLAVKTARVAFRYRLARTIAINAPMPSTG